MGKPMLEKRASQPIVFPSDAEAGMEFYSNSIIAADKTIADDPKLVAAFLRATQKGMKDAFANPKEAAKELNKASLLPDCSDHSRRKRKRCLNSPAPQSERVCRSSCLTPRRLRRRSRSSRTTSR